MGAGGGVDVCHDCEETHTPAIRLSLPSAPSMCPEWKGREMYGEEKWHMVAQGFHCSTCGSNYPIRLYFNSDYCSLSFLRLGP